MKRMALAVAGIVALGIVGSAQPAHSATGSIKDVCAHRFASPFNVGAAAGVKTLDAQGRTTPVGRTGAERVIGVLVSGTAGNSCERPRSDSVEGVIDAVEADIAAGDRDNAIIYLRDYLAGLTFTPSTQRTRAKAPDPFTAKCEEFNRSSLAPPEAYFDALAVATFADGLGDPTMAAEATARARSIAEEWAASGAATSVADWILVLDYLQEVGASTASQDAAVKQARAQANAAFGRYNTSACRATAQDIECLTKSVIVLKALGAAPAGADAAVSAGLKAWRDGIGRGKRVSCPLERYEFQMTYTEQGGGSGFTRLDTGRVAFEVAGGRITSKDKGPLVVTGGTGQCWEEGDQGWMMIGSGPVTGGSWPYKVGGRDLGSDLLLQLKQRAAITASISGAPICEAAGKLAVEMVNTMLASYSSPGIELPAGAWNYEDTITTREVYEPTGAMVTKTLYINLKMTYPRR